MSEIGLGIFAAVALMLALVLAYGGGRSVFETKTADDCASLQMFRVGSAVYDCKKRAP